MGECACGELNTREGYEVAGLILVPEIYPGCVGCETGVQVSLHLFTPEQAREYHIEIKGSLTPGEHGHTRKSFVILDAADLAEAAGRLDERRAGFDDVGALAEVLPSKLTLLLQEGVAASRRKAAKGREGGNKAVS